MRGMRKGMRGEKQTPHLMPKRWFFYALALAVMLSACTF